MSKKLYKVNYKVSDGLYYFGEADEQRFRQACLNDVSNVTFTTEEVTERPETYDFGWVGDECPYGENFSTTRPTLDHIVCELFPVVAAPAPSVSTLKNSEEIITILGKKYKLTPID